MPELWSSLHYFNEEFTTRSQKVQGVQMWFSHAGQLPLSLTLTDTEDSSVQPTVDFVKEIIIPYSRRFQRLHLVLRPPQVRDLLSLPSGSLDNLEELHVVLHVGMVPASILPAWKPIISAFSSNAKLRRFRVRLTPLVIPRIFHLPWHKLETFRCDSSLQLEDCHELLLSCQALRKMHIRVFGIRYASVPRIEIPLPNLVNLNVQLCDEEPYDLFFRPLVLPALKTLVIYHYEGLPWSHDMYTSLLERSGCQIEELYLGTLDADSQSIDQVLTCSAKLRSLTISHNTEVEPYVFHKIGNYEIGSSLEQLYLKGTRLLDPILTMLEARQNAMVTDDSTLSPLLFVETHCSDQEQLAYANRIETLQKDGIHLSLTLFPEEHFQL
ncbi:hypothetical protein CVT24_008444 [Panaeolus cyanescens]|uniref:F-box domain-containing protein n=1 Tax=Panaeolus cyanescens TaxID=181874 RepID=A0A409VC02_9AGAR|nr:hypothetical protein CVT24_008444 [Panaeolus cyanescens]